MFFIEFYCRVGGEFKAAPRLYPIHSIRPLPELERIAAKVGAAAGFDGYRLAWGRFTAPNYLSVKIHPTDVL